MAAGTATTAAVAMATTTTTMVLATRRRRRRLRHQPQPQPPANKTKTEADPHVLNLIPSSSTTRLQTSYDSLREATYCVHTAESSTVPRPTSQSSTDIHGLPLRPGALSLNRVIWRSMLQMGDEGPGTNSTQLLPAPLDTDQINNILSTCRAMPAQDKLAFMSGFVRFLLEVAQQAFEAMILNRDPAGVEPTEAEDQDHVMMMQENLELQRRPTKLRSTFSLLHGALALRPGCLHQRADTLRRRLESRYFGRLPHDCSLSELQEGHAMLVGMCDNIDDSIEGTMQPRDSDDATFVQDWWRRLHPQLLGLDRLHPMLLAPPVEWPDSPLDLDTPPDPIDASKHSLNMPSCKKLRTSTWLAWQKVFTSQSHLRCTLPGLVFPPPLTLAFRNVMLALSAADSNSQSLSGLDKNQQPPLPTGLTTSSTLRSLRMVRSSLFSLRFVFDLPLLLGTKLKKARIRRTMRTTMLSCRPPPALLRRSSAASPLTYNRPPSRSCVAGYTNAGLPSRLSCKQFFRLRFESRLAKLVKWAQNWPRSLRTPLSPSSWPVMVKRLSPMHWSLQMPLLALLSHRTFFLCRGRIEHMKGPLTSRWTTSMRHWMPSSLTLATNIASRV